MKPADVDVKLNVDTSEAKASLMDLFTPTPTEASERMSKAKAALIRAQARLFEAGAAALVIVAATGLGWSIDLWVR